MIHLRWTFLALALNAFALSAGAREGPEEERSVEEAIDALEAERARLVEERDAARMRANTFVLPKDKVEAQEKQAEIEATDRALEALREEAALQAERRRTAQDPDAPR